MLASIPGASRVLARAVKVLHRWRRDTGGNIAMMFALVAIPLIGAVGLAVDMGRMYHIALDTQGALDAAALAAGRAAQIDKSGTLDKASKAAGIYFNQAKPTDVVETKIEFSPNAQRTEFTVTATSWVSTPFLSVLHLFGHKGSQDDAPAACKGNYYACSKVVTTATAQICLNCNSDDGTNLEIALMLDVTGSMAGDKIVDLKAAAKDLIDIVIWEDQSKWTSRVALAPFAAAMNVGPYFEKITGKNDREDNDGKANRNIHYPPECLTSKGAVKSDCSNDSKKYNQPEYIATYARCVVERTNGGSQHTDDAPTNESTWLPTWNNATESMSKSCTPSAAVVPLTSRSQMLKDTIDTFAASGSTAGQLGTAFAWYLLSPNWSEVWPVESAPTAYGTPKVKKIAVLMTDGEYNTIQGSSSNGSNVTLALGRAQSLCNAMKKNAHTSDPNIEVFTVGFKLDSSAGKAMLKNCASSPNHYYETSTGDALKAAFRDIALRISRLRLTH